MASGSKLIKTGKLRISKTKLKQLKVKINSQAKSIGKQHGAYVHHYTFRERELCVGKAQLALRYAVSGRYTVPMAEHIKVLAKGQNYTIHEKEQLKHTCYAYWHH